MSTVEIRELTDADLDTVSGGMDSNYQFCWNGPAGAGVYPWYTDCGGGTFEWGTDEDAMHAEIKGGGRPN